MPFNSTQLFLEPSMGGSVGRGEGERVVRGEGGSFDS